METKQANYDFGLFVRAYAQRDHTFDLHFARHVTLVFISSVEEPVPAEETI